MLWKEFLNNGTQHLVYMWYVMTCADNNYGAQWFIGYYTIIPCYIVWYVTAFSVVYLCVYVCEMIDWRNLFWHIF